MSRELQAAFLAMLPTFIAALKLSPPEFPPSLRVRLVQGKDGVWELTFAPDGRATFAYGPEVIGGTPHIISGVGSVHTPSSLTPENNQPVGRANVASRTVGHGTVHTVARDRCPLSRLWRARR